MIADHSPVWIRPFESGSQPAAHRQCTVCGATDDHPSTVHLDDGTEIPNPPVEPTVTVVTA